MYPYSVNEKVLYGSVGVCEIKEITKKDFGGQSLDYYVLVPLYKNQSTVYVPVNSVPLCEKMRRLPDKDSISKLFECAKADLPEWEENKYIRRDKFTEIIEKGSDKEIFVLVRVLYEQNKKQLEKGKKLHITDERFLTEAQKLIDDEIAYVLDLPREGIGAYIAEQIKEVCEKQ